MYYGVEQSTDMRDHRTVIKKFARESPLRVWMQNSGGFTYGDPEGAQNFHHTFRYGYRLDGRIDMRDRVFKNLGTPTYPVSRNDQIATYLFKHGERIE